jgi:hypothetical protein
VDWKSAATVLVPIASVVASSWVVIKSKSIEAVSRHADRQHERELSYEERAWELKNAALTTLIDACDHLLKEARLSDSVLYPRRARVVTAMERFRARVRGTDGVIGQLLAYAADPVRNAVDQLLDVIEAERNLHATDLVLLSRLEPDLAAMHQELHPAPGPNEPTTPPLDVQQRYVQLNQAIALRRNEIATRSQLDVEKVIALCNQVIDAARDDLHAKRVEEPQPHRISRWQRRLTR